LLLLLHLLLSRLRVAQLLQQITTSPPTNNRLLLPLLLEREGLPAPPRPVSLAGTGHLAPLLATCPPLPIVSHALPSLMMMVGEVRMMRLVLLLMRRRGRERLARVLKKKSLRL